MKFNKIHIIGGPGSGKSYLAKKLGYEYKYSILDLDNIFWDNKASHYGTKADAKTRDAMLKRFLKNDKYVVEGVYYKWLSDSFNVADIIVIIDTNVIVRTYRIVRRFLKRKFGLEKGKNENIKNLINLIKWNYKYNKENLLPASEMLKCNKKTMIFKNADDAYKYLLEK